MDLSAYSKQQLKVMLKEATDKYHELVTGQSAVNVMRAGRSVTFTQANKDELKAWIITLQVSLGVDVSNSATRRRPMGVMF